MSMAGLAGGAAKRRRERQLRSFLRHEELSVKMALARALHHSTQRVEVPREGVEGEKYYAPRRQKPPPPGDAASQPGGAARGSGAGPAAHCGLDGRCFVASGFRRSCAAVGGTVAA